MKIKVGDVKNTQSQREHGNIEGLRQSISENGLINPITIDENNNLMAGRRRFQAITELGWKEVDVRILPISGDRLKAFRISIDENLKRKPLTNPEIASSIKDYDDLKRQLEGEKKAGGDRQSISHTIANGWTQEKTAQDLGISRQAVGQAIQVAKAIEEHPKWINEKGVQILAKVSEQKARFNKYIKELETDDIKTELAKLSVPTEFVKEQVTLKLGDFRELITELPDNSIDLILTDPPYPKEYLPLWLDLAKEASRVLKPSKFLVAYSGQNYLPQVINSLSKHLNYYWLGMLYHKGSTAQRFEVNMWNRAKPILFFYKPPCIKQELWIEDVIESPHADKEHHTWGQNIEPLKKLLKVFSSPGQVILEPFAGGGATIAACIETKCKVIAYEQDEDSYKTIIERIK